MRFILVAIIWVVMVGGLAFYTYGRRGGVARNGPSTAAAALNGTITIELTPTFTAEPDPFALQTSTAEKPAALLLRLNGRELARISEKLDRGRPLRFEPKEGVTTGTNELFVEASPPADQFDQAAAVRIRVYRNGLLLTDRTVWSEAGSKASGSIFFAGSGTARDEHQH